MNREKAQHILLAYRLGEAVPTPSDLAEALDLAANDPALASWLEQELTADRVLRVKLREVRPPLGLHDRIRSATRRIEVAWWQKPRIWAAAAAVTFLLGSAVWWFVRTSAPARPLARAVNRLPVSDLDTFRTEMTRFVSQGAYNLQLNSEQFAEVKRYLAKRGSEAAQLTPAELARLATYGCQIFEWNGESVTLICFQSADLGIAHLFVIQAGALRDAPSKERTFSKVDSWAAASWFDGDKAVLVCSPAEIGALKRFLRG